MVADTKSEASPSYSSVMLTPPPEASWTANRLLFASTLAPEERKLIAAFTPPKSDHSLHSVMTGGAAIALTDLALSVQDDDDEAQTPEELEARQLEQQALNDFETLINHEGGGDLLHTDKGIYAEMNMAWLNGMNDEDEEEPDQNAGIDMFTKHEDEPVGGYQEVSKSMTGDLDADLGVWTHV
jgi:hypothetical protein